MAYAKINGVTNANMAKIGNVAKAGFGKISGQSPPVVFTDTYSIDLDGNDDHMDTGLVMYNRNVTVSAWLKQDSGSYDEAWGGDMSGNRTKILGLSTYFSGGLRFYIGDGSSSYSFNVTSGVNIADGNWHNVIITIGGDDENDNTVDLSVWVNGVQKYDVDNHDLGMDAAQFTFGMGYMHPGCGCGSFNGKIGDTAVWQDQFTTAEAVAVYNSGTPFNLTANSSDYTSSSALVGYWKYEENTGTSVADSSTNSNNGTLSNGASFIEDTP
jgi:hypothetical protein|tara:strand:+ start:321 stop:1127 length:807 start_codon:yes stop_codon:yes gene_type:complete